MGYVAISEKQIDDAIAKVKQFLETEVSTKEEIISALKKLTPLELAILDEIRKSK